MGFARSFRDLVVYQNALTLALRVFELTKRFPAEEKYSLTDRIRRSSRSVCANIAEAWRKRRYKAAFIAKLSDAETEAAETQVWCELAQKCGYLDAQIANELDHECERIIAQLVRMIDQPERWLISSSVTPTHRHPDT